MNDNNEKPVIVQSDGSILLEVMCRGYEEARDAILGFAELIKSPEYIHTYRITPLSIWNAAATGMEYSRVMEILNRYSRYDLPKGVIFHIKDAFDRWGVIRLTKHDSGRLMVSLKSKTILDDLVSRPAIGAMVIEEKGPDYFFISPDKRGVFKHLCIKNGYPVNDLVGYEPGEPLEIQTRDMTISGEAFVSREYQEEACDHFWAKGSSRGGQGIVILPCGSGKTIVGMGIMARAQTYTLILCTNVSAVHQWIQELLDKTTLKKEDIGEYTGAKKEIRPVTVSTYQILTYRKSKHGPFKHMQLIDALNWGLLIYDEVHVLPAPVFRATTQIQTKRRLGLTATLIREDGLEKDTFSLVGPKCYDVPWKQLEQKGFIAQAVCIEIRIPLSAEDTETYVLSGDRARFRIASENQYKDIVADELIRSHPGESILVIGQYIKQLKRISAALDAPMITGSTPESSRDRLYTAFRKGHIPVLVVSKVANFAIDLPDASVAIQISGTFGSRQEEAQRLGRILRPKQRMSTFYTLVSQRTAEETFAHKRQIFLAEQGYKYRIEERSRDDLE
ncbi:MAG: DNA repair helicase XPB [Thermodesulfobacteriota bacterium]|nr:DNA repair helicase XPB [Thermodesulfobacteriota bacterium]